MPRNMKGPYLNSMRKIYKEIRAMWHIYILYEVYKIYKPYTLYGIKQSIKMVKMYLDKENIA